jgi:2,3-bisphosphoglycerate-independent phosphoglycerate mutase
MVGHTGNFEATVKAAEVVDEQLKRLSVFLPETTMMIVADHGNAEMMISPTNQPYTNHTVNPVPFIIVNPQFQRVQNDAALKPTGILADIAPTILRFYGIDPVPEMTGQDLTQLLR